MHDMTTFNLRLNGFVVGMGTARRRQRRMADREAGLRSDAFGGYPAAQKGKTRAAKRA